MKREAFRWSPLRLCLIAPIVLLAACDSTTAPVSQATDSTPTSATSKPTNVVVIGSAEQATLETDTAISAPPMVATTQPAATATIPEPASTTPPQEATSAPTTAAATTTTTATPVPTTALAAAMPPAAATDDTASPYVDDHSSPEQLIQSFYSAVNRKEYVRAYGYRDAPGGSPDGPPEFTQFQAGYADTASVELKLGTIGSDSGAGQVYYSVPVALMAKNSEGVQQTFVGCYTLHLSQPAIQAVPPFRPLGIQAAQIQQVANDADTARLLVQACQSQVAPYTPPAATSPTDIGPSRYLDDRSNPGEVLRSYYNAVNRKEYARAYSYWDTPAGAPNGPPEFTQFQAGYADTSSVQLTTGTVTSDAGAGQLYYTVPAALISTNSEGVQQTFVGCYTLHLSQPAIQAVPPFRPLGIASAAIQQVPNDADTVELLNQSCH